MRKQTKLIVALSLVLILAFGSAASAFDDVRGTPAEASILALKQAGIVNGIGSGHFDPQGTMTAAQAIQLIVSGIQLDLAHIQFIKEPKASDHFAHIDDNAWYARAFVIAFHNGLDLAADLNPHEVVTREQFAHWLMQAVHTTGMYPFIKIYIVMADEQEVGGDFMGSVQQVLIAKIAELDNEQRFEPQRTITRAEAAVWTHRAIEFIEKATPIQPEPEIEITEDVSFEVESVTKEINKVTVSWGYQPHPGYGISVDKIEFHGEEAHIFYQLHYPDPDMMYPQVIVEPKAVVYIAAEYTPVLHPGKQIMPSPGTVSESSAEHR